MVDRFSTDFPNNQRPHDFCHIPNWPGLQPQRVLGIGDFDSVAKSPTLTWVLRQGPFFMVGTAGSSPADLGPV